MISKYQQLSAYNTVYPRTLIKSGLKDKDYQIRYFFVGTLREPLIYHKNGREVRQHRGFMCAVMNCNTGSKKGWEHVHNYSTSHDRAPSSKCHRCNRWFRREQEYRAHLDQCEECSVEAERSSGRRGRASNIPSASQQENVIDMINASSHFRSAYAYQIPEERLLYDAIIIPDVNIYRRVVHDPKAPPLLRIETLAITDKTARATHSVAEADNIGDGGMHGASTAGSTSCNGDNSVRDNFLLYIPN